jgi:hypothetical protein
MVPKPPSLFQSVAAPPPEPPDKAWVIQHPLLQLPCQEAQFELLLGRTAEYPQNSKTIDVDLMRIKLK